MSGAGRRLQRRNRGSHAREALAQARQAVANLQGVGLDRLPAALRELEAQTARAAQLADALAEDYETLAEELEIQREVNIRLCTRTSGANSDSFWRQAEAFLRREVQDEREQRNAESATAKEA